MQYLIDIITEIVRNNGMYVHRGDPPLFDFTILDLTADNAWHDLDLSAIVPANAHAVNLITNISGTQAFRNVKLRSKAVAGTINVLTVWNQVANVKLGGCFAVAVDSNRMMQYKISHVSLNLVSFVVSGWWF